MCFKGAVKETASVVPRIQARLREIATRERTALASLTEVMDSIVVYPIDQDNGQFTLVKIVPTSGANPRNFGLDPTDTCLSVGNHSTDDIFTSASIQTPTSSHKNVWAFLILPSLDVFIYRRVDLERP